MYDDKYWNERYRSEEFLYGLEPNSFLAEHSNLLNGKVLSLSEGEGRNAVFLASQGLEVYGVDLSEVALNKAQALAKSRNVEIQTEVTDLAEFEPQKDFYDAVISISAHLPSVIRNRLYPLVEKSLKPGGIIILEAYSENQLA
ncbi:MAG: class I SAM-dependent methyltransferase, partial [Arenicella sp.]